MHILYQHNRYAAPGIQDIVKVIYLYDYVQDWYDIHGMGGLGSIAIKGKVDGWKP